MPLIERYIFRRAAYAVLLTLGALVATLWLTQVMRELDVVTAKGQAIWVFLLITLLSLPVLIQAVAPVALLAGTLVTLNSLTADSELPVISGAGAPRKAVNRPILTLAVLIAVLVALSYHFLAPASLAGLRGILNRVRADVIATLVRDGGFRSVDDGLTMHVREKAPDGSFRDIFVNDDRNPAESVQYSAAQGVVVERSGSSYLVLQEGHLIRDERAGPKASVVAFETYALDLSQIGAGAGADLYKARERSTLYLLNPSPDDVFAVKHPDRVAAEIHDRITAPLYALAFALIALALLGQPRTTRQDRNTALALAVFLCVALRIAGFAAVAAAGNHRTLIPAMYLVPLLGIGFGLYGAFTERRLRMPGVLAAAWDVAQGGADRLRRRLNMSRGVPVREMGS